MDKRGYIFSLDVFFSILIIVLILGISANAMDITGNKILDFNSEQTYERIANDMCDVLLKTSGSPSDWERMTTLVGATPGLKDDGNGTAMNKVSMKKINSLKSNPKLLNRIMPEGFNCSIMLYSIDSALPNISIIDGNPQNASEVYTVNRTVSYSYDSYVVYSTIKKDNYFDNSDDYSCPHSTLYDQHQKPDFDRSKPGWICTEFKVPKQDLNRTDFYLLTDPPVLLDNNASWLIDKPSNTNETPKKFSNGPLNINSIIKGLSADDGVIIFHVYTSGKETSLFDVYLVGVPVGSSINSVKLNYFGIKQGYFILKMWD